MVTWEFKGEHARPKRDVSVASVSAPVTNDDNWKEILRRSFENRLRLGRSERKGAPDRT